MTSVRIYGPTDPDLDAFLPGFEAYVAAHPDATVEIYRESPRSIRARITDPGFRDLSRTERFETYKPFIRALRLPDDVYAQLVSCPLVTPAEAAARGSSLAFDDHKPRPPAAVPAPAAARKKRPR